MKLNATQYMESNGALCPFCESNDIEGGNVEVSSGSAWQSVKCNSCDESWQDNYKLECLVTYPDGEYTEHFPDSPLT